MTASLNKASVSSRAFPLNHDRSMLLILLPRHPHLLEAAAGAQNRPSNPRSEPLFSTANNLDPDVLTCDIRHLLLQSLHEAPKASVTTSDDDILKQVTPDVDVSLADGIHHHVVDTCEAF